MRLKEFIFIAIALAAIITILFVTFSGKHAEAPSEAPVKFYMYGSPYCPHCRNMKVFLENNYGRDKVVFLDVYGDEKAREAMDKLVEKGLPSSVPLTFIVYNNTVSSIILGENRDKGFIDKLLYTNSGFEIPLYEPSLAGFIQRRVVLLSPNYTHADLILFLEGKSTRLDVKLIEKTLVTPVYNYTETTVATDGLLKIIIPLIPHLIVLSLLDSINPCTFALYSSFTLTCISGKSRRTGPPILFIILIYIGYLLFGLGLSYIAFRLGGYRVVLIILALVLGLINVFSAGKLSNISYKCVWCNKFKLPLKTFTNKYLLAIFLSIFSIVFLLPCTAGPLLIFTSIISGLSIQIKTILLSIYNAIFIVPLILILLLILKLGKHRSIANWVERNTGVLEFISGVFLIIVALVFIGLTI